MPNELIGAADIYDNLVTDIKAANQGNESALNQLRSKLDQQEADQFVRQYCDLGWQVEEKLLAVLDHQPGEKACIRARLSRLRDELGWQTASPMVRLLINSVGIAWLDYHFAHIRFSMASGGPVGWLDHLQKRMDRAHNRYLKSIKTLATVRKMALPTLIQVQANFILSERK